LEIAYSCFTDGGILWKRITRNGKQKTVIDTPKSMRYKIILDMHSDVMIGHENKNKTKERLISSYWWPGMDTEIDIHIKSCDKSQKTTKEKRGSIMFGSTLPQCSEPNQRIQMDLLGPLKTMPSGKKFILCVTDAFSKYAEQVEIPDKRAATVAFALFSRW
jgi:hypothetical protein